VKGTGDDIGVRVASGTAEESAASFLEA